MSVTITIKTASLLDEVRQKSYMNTEHIKDEEARYAARAREEVESELYQAFQDAWRSLLLLCRRYLVATTDTAGNDVLSTATTDRTITLDVTARRTSNLADALAQAMHEFLVGGTLRRFYTSAAVPDLAGSYLASEKAATVAVQALIFTKGEPTIRP